MKIVKNLWILGLLLQITKQGVQNQGGYPESHIIILKGNARTFVNLLKKKEIF
jgi:hypothetical protein